MLQGVRGQGVVGVGVVAEFREDPRIIAGPVGSTEVAFHFSEKMRCLRKKERGPRGRGQAVEGGWVGRAA